MFLSLSLFFVVYASLINGYQKYCLSWTTWQSSLIIWLVLLKISSNIWTTVEKSTSSTIGDVDIFVAIDKFFDNTLVDYSFEMFRIWDLPNPKNATFVQVVFILNEILNDIYLRKV